MYDVQDKLGAKKCVHLKLKHSTHAELRELLTPKSLSIQEVFEEFAQRICLHDEYAMSLLDDIIMRKLMGKHETSKLSQTDISMLLDLMDDDKIEAL